MTNSLRVGEVFRYSRPYSSSAQQIGTFRNHFFVTNLNGGKLVLLERGINQIAAVKAKDGVRVPAVLIRSSPHKIGSIDTPWHDVFDVNNGFIRYYGDNKTPGQSPERSLGNKILLELYRIYTNEQMRIHSVPLLFYKSVEKSGSSKGYLEFNGFGIIKGVELKTQYDRSSGFNFTNFAFDFHVFKLDRENELFNWQWINDRRNPDLTIDETNRHAPFSWVNWIKEGNRVLEKNRRRVSAIMISNRREQIPDLKSPEYAILAKVYNYYNGKKHEFEYLAAFVTEKILNKNGNGYRTGWITKKSGDSGVDFYGRLDIGKGFGKAKLIVLGQAKCEKPSVPTNGKDVARTVARLRRGWIGVYVTTSFFSDPVQQEIIEDEYPIMLINGRKLAEIILEEISESGYTDLFELLSDVDKEYSSKISIRRPEELLYDN